jgi:hypothetical protein
VTPEARNRAPFELRRFRAAAVSADLATVELEGQFAGSRGRFARQPVLVVEAPGAPRAELAPVTAQHDGDRWRGTYAAPLGALDGGTFALGLRGVLYDLPAPDLAGEADRLAAVAREANALRRRVEALESERDSAVAEAQAARAELEGAVTAAREEAAAQSAQRIEDLEREVAAAHEAAAGDADEARTAAEAARAAAVAEVEARAAAERERAEVAEARAAAAEERERHEAAGADVLRAELAEERERAQAAIAELQERLDAANAADADEPRTTVAPTRRRETPAEEPEPTSAMDPATEAQGASDDDESGPVPITRRPPPRHQPPPAPAPVQHHGPSLSPWIAVAALFVFAFLVVALVLNLLG